MFKTLTTVLMLAVASTPVYAQTEAESQAKACSSVREISNSVATLRDRGEPAGKEFQFLIVSGLPEGIAYQLVLDVYTNLRGSSPEGIGSFYYGVCMGELA